MQTVRCSPASCSTPALPGPAAICACMRGRMRSRQPVAGRWSAAPGWASGLAGIRRFCRDSRYHKAAGCSSTGTKRGNRKGMKVPARLQPLVEDGLVDEVISQLMSGKEAQVYVVRCGDQIRCAKVYKEAGKRSFKQAVQYQEGRNVKNSRSARAIGKRSRYGQKESEQAWLNAEVDALRRLGSAGVRVPRTHGFVDGVLLMDMISDEEGLPAPRLNDVTLSAEQAREYHGRVIRDVVRMLCAG